MAAQYIIPSSSSSTVINKAAAASSNGFLVTWPPMTSLFVPNKKLHNRRQSRFNSSSSSSSNSVVVAMVQQSTGGGGGAPANYAKEMERLSAKESLLLAFKDAGGFQALVTGKTTDEQKIDVNERITGLERLNPTPRPTTSPFLDGRWNFEWVGSGTPGFFAARAIFERLPTTLANFSNMDIYIKDGYGKVNANVKLLNSIETSVTISCKLSVEGPLRMKEEYVELILESPKVTEETMPDQVKGVFGQVVNAAQQLPLPIRDAVNSGLTVPLSKYFKTLNGCFLIELDMNYPCGFGGTYKRFFLISYLDEEILIIRDTTGVPEVLTRLEQPSSPIVEVSVPEWVLMANSTVHGQIDVQQYTTLPIGTVHCLFAEKIVGY
ncbi:hypothetical protein ACFE04_029837 [Oxalis oulophora]